MHSNGSAKQLSGAGRAGMDLYADPPGTRTEEAQSFTSALGGSAANIAAGIVRLGGKASLVTTVSDDAVGRYMRRVERYGIDIAYVLTVARRSAYVAGRCRDPQRELPVGHLSQWCCRFRSCTRTMSSGIAYGDFGALIVTGTALPSTLRAPPPCCHGDAPDLPPAGDSRCRLPALFLGQCARTRRHLRRRAAYLSDIVDRQRRRVRRHGGRHRRWPRLGAPTLAERRLRKTVIYKMGEKGSITLRRRPYVRDRHLPRHGAEAHRRGRCLHGRLRTCAWPPVSISPRRCGAARLPQPSSSPASAARPPCPTPIELADFIASHPRPA